MIKTTHGSIQVSQEIESLVASKVLAIEEVYKKWGRILTKEIKSLLPRDTGKLRKAISFEVRSPRNKKDITKLVELIVGVTDKTYWKNKNLIRFFEKGTTMHFVPVKAKSGYYTGILGYAQRHNLIFKGTKTIGYDRKENSRSTWRWKKNQHIFFGFMNMLPARHMFFKTFHRYDEQIRREVMEIINAKI